jgi:hypothetical protein
MWWLMGNRRERDLLLRHRTYAIDHGRRIGVPFDASRRGRKRRRWPSPGCRIRGLGRAYPPEDWQRVREVAPDSDGDRRGARSRAFLMTPASDGR